MNRDHVVTKASRTPKPEPPRRQRARVGRITKATQDAHSANPNYLFPTKGQVVKAASESFWVGTSREELSELLKVRYPGAVGCGW